MAEVSTGSTGTGRPEYDQEVSLADYLAVLWRYRLVLMGIVVTTAIVTLLVDSTRPRVYQSVSRLLVSASKIGDAVPPVSMGNYQAIVGSQSLVASTLDELGLLRPPHNYSVAEVTQSHLSVHVIPETNVIQVTARFSQPDLAAQFANRLAEKAVALTTASSQEDTVAARGTMKVQLDESRARFDLADQKLEAFQKQVQFDALEAEVEAMVKERARLLPLMIELEAARARVRQIAEELTKHKPVRDVRGATAPRSASGEQASPLTLREDVVNPYANPVYEALEHQLAQDRATVTSLERERATILQATSTSDAAGRKVGEFYAAKSELDRLKMEKELAQRVYVDTSSRYEQARIQVASRSATVQLIDAAVPANTPVSPRILRDVVAAIAGSLVLATGAILLLTALRSSSAAR